MQHYKKLQIFIVLSILFLAGCKKDNNPVVPDTKWEKINLGVEARAVYDLQVYNSTIFAGTDSGICISSDKGKTWNNYNTTGKRLNIKKIFFDNNIIYVGTKDAGVYVSYDFGVNWTPMNTGIQASIATIYPEISSFISDSNYIYAGLPSISLNTPKPSQIYRKRIDQDKWESFDSGLEAIGIRAFYKYEGRIYAGTWEGIYVFEPVLSKWIKFGESNLSFVRFYTKKTSLFCSVEQQNIGMMISSNGGYSWRSSNTGIGSDDIVWSFSEDIKNNIYCTSYGKVFSSSGEGNTWIKIGDGLPQESILSSVVVNNNIFVGSNWNGVWVFKL